MGKPETAPATGLSLTVSDVTGQKIFVVANAPVDGTVGELIQDMLGKMGMPSADPNGRPFGSL